MPCHETYVTRCVSLILLRIEFFGYFSSLGIIFQMNIASLGESEYILLILSIFLFLYICLCKFYSAARENFLFSRCMQRIFSFHNEPKLIAFGKGTDFIFLYKSLFLLDINAKLYINSTTRNKIKLWETFKFF